MLTTEEFVRHLRGLDIKLSVDDGERLRCSAPKGALTPALQAELRTRKAEVVAWLEAEGRASVPPAGGEPLSFAQQRLWFIDQFQPGGWAYNIASGLRLQGRLDVAALERSVADLLERHEPLRTVITAEDGRPVQVVTPFQAPPLPLLESPPHPAEARLDAVEDLLVEEARRPFDLARGPLFRARLFRLAPDDHLLQLTIHHIVADGWSLGILTRELTELYGGHAAGAGNQLPPLTLRYGDIAARQRQRLTGRVLDQIIEYWKSRLTPLPPVLELPTDFPRPAVQTDRGGVESFVLPAVLAERLAQLSREQGATPFMTLFSAYCVLLHRYTGATDLAVGVPIANRTDLASEAVIGLLMNTLVLRADLSGNPTFRELLLRVRDVALDAYSHQDLPFERLVEIINPARDMSHSVLFQAMFIYQNFPPQPLEIAGLHLSYPPIRTGTSKTDLCLEIVDRPDGLGMYFEYNSDLFRPATVRRMCGHLETLLAAAVADPEQRIARLPMTSGAERHRLMVEWNATEAPELALGTIPGRFEAEAARAPGAVAARFEGQALSYEALNQRVNQLAHHLQRRGAGPGGLVGVLVERSLDMLIAVLAVMKSGAAYVPLDPAYPPDRITFMLEDAGIRLIISQASLLDRGAIPDGSEVIAVDRDAAAIAACPVENPSPGPAPGDLAYVLYTSGSTGRPKGVGVGHRALANVIGAFHRSLTVAPRDVLLSVTTLSFDIAGLELYLPLAAGATVVIAGRDAALDPARLMELLADSGATLMQATPVTWRMLIEAGWNRGAGLRILVGGEPFPAELAGPLVATGAEVWNVYGPTETTIWSTMHRVVGTEIPVPIGRPIANTQVYVLDGAGEPAPIGVPGELFIGGDGVAEGYLGRPELTAEKFVPNRFSVRPGARLYRTGDVVRFREDGTLDFVGRLDHQVKIRGFRIELGEVESVLATHPAVAHAVVADRQDGAGVRYLSAYVRLGTLTPPSSSELRDFLKARLPDYMVPSVFTVLEAFPQTPNGKVDRKRLPEPDPQRLAPSAAFLAPEGEVERTVAEAWREVLQVDQVGMDDNFFDLGGHSLLLIQVQARLRRALSRDIPILEMFQYPTVRTMASHLAAHPVSREAA